jgi:hypothetical protein
MTRKKDPLATPFSFLLGCSQADLSSIELTRLSNVADLRAELHVILDKIIDEMTQAALAAWFRVNDRETLRRALATEEDTVTWAKRMARDGQRSGSELLPQTALEPGKAHLAASLQYQQRNVAAGKCRSCPQPLARNSVKYCETHLAMQRAQNERRREHKNPDAAGMHGRQAGTLKSLAENRKKQAEKARKRKEDASGL